jgi:DNA-binding transcriptional MerR regulator
MTDTVLWTATKREVMRVLKTTPRQIQYWAENGAFIPESTVRGHYTPSDVIQLQRLREIIVEDRCPVHLARELYECRRQREEPE